ncbi:hypothetical protein ACI1VO_30005, partial [Escherichia coli]|uniref:hypothetical protein n=1 Tax=Escherichia coli TaxID=562 RepID=UPI00384CDD00
YFCLLLWLCVVLSIQFIFFVLMEWPHPRVTEGGGTGTGDGYKGQVVTAIACSREKGPSGNKTG